jgi:hypothetical protein
VILFLFLSSLLIAFVSFLAAGTATSQRGQERPLSTAKKRPRFGGGMRRMVSCYYILILQCVPQQYTTASNSNQCNKYDQSEATRRREKKNEDDIKMGGIEVPNHAGFEISSLIIFRFKYKQIIYFNFFLGRS